MLALLAHLALAHPGAASHLHETEADACEPEVRARRLGALLDEGLLALARAEVDQRRSCPVPSSGAEVGEARLLLLEGHADQAVARLDALLGREPGHPGALEQRAAAHLALGDRRGAATDLLALARAHPGALDAWREAAGHAAAVDPALAVAIVDEARAHHAAPDLDERAADALIALGRPAEALARVAATPESVPVLRLRARALAAQADPAAAAAALDRALVLCGAMRASPAREALCASIRDERAGLP